MQANKQTIQTIQTTLKIKTNSANIMNITTNTSKHQTNNINISKLILKYDEHHNTKGELRS